MYRILVIDDEESVRYSFTKLLAEPEYQVIQAQNGEQGLQKLQSEHPDLIILDIQMPGLSGLEVLQQIKMLAPKTPVLVITAFGSSDRVIKAMKYGAYEYIEKPFDIPVMKNLIDEALEVSRIMRSRVVVASEENGTADTERIIGNSSGMREVYKMIGRVAANPVNILLLGESGTGKELVARAIYQYSTLHDQPFLEVNCAAIPETLLESELFGYEKGAFTGANKRKIGKFQQADGGTIFLDEIGDMSLATQSKILRVLQDGKFEPVGSNETIQCRVRIIAATNKNLEKVTEAKQFREDLYYRLKVITIVLPPLRERKEDIPDLTDYFIKKHSVLLNKEYITVAPETLELFIQYDWPGNVRELENVIKRAIILMQGNVITPHIVMEDLQPAADTQDDHLSRKISGFIPQDLDRYHGHLYASTMAVLERELIIAALNKEKGNQVKAARLLGISRMMLHERIQRYQIKTEVHIE